MKNKTMSLAFSLVALGSVAAHAQDVTGAATLGFGSGSIDGGGDFSTLSFDGAVDTEFANGLAIGAGLSLTRVDPDGAASDTKINNFDLDAMYGFGNGFGVGAYFERGKISEDLGVAGLTDEGSVESYGLQVGYSMQGVDVKGFLGKSETDPDLPSGVDWKDLGAHVTYQIGGSSVIGGHFVRSTIDGPGGDADLNSIGIGGAHSFGNGWMGYAGLQRASLDEVDLDATTLGIGIAYDLSDVSFTSAIASLELARSTFDDGIDSFDVDTIRIGFTFPIGTKATQAPLNSVAQSAIAPNRNALTSTLLSSF